MNQSICEHICDSENVLISNVSMHIISWALGLFPNSCREINELVPLHIVIIL